MTIKPLTPEQRDQASRFVGAAIKIAARYRHLADFDELKSACTAAICQAVRRYDPTKGRSLPSYVILWIRAAARRTIEQTLRRPETNADIPEPGYTEPRDPTGFGVTDLPAWDRMTPRSREILSLYLATGSMSAVAGRLGSSVQYVHQTVSSFVLSARGDLCRA